MLTAKTTSPRRAPFVRGAKTAIAMGTALGLFLVVAVPAAQAAPADPVDVPDAALLECMNAALPTPQAPAYAITEGEAAAITQLMCVDKGVQSLEGIESLTTATSIYLNSNDLPNGEEAHLANLTDLEVLVLSGNNVADLSFLTNLTSLTSLYLAQNDVTDISELQGLPLLEFVYLESNQISDVSPLAGLTDLRGLQLGGNQISDVSSLSGLTVTNWVDVRENAIADVSPLDGITSQADINAANQTVALGALTVGNAQPNPVVGFDGNPVPLDAPYDADPAAFTPTTAGPGSASWSAATFSGTLTFTANDPALPVNIPDEQLLMCINQALDPARDADEQVTEAEAATIAQLFCDDNGVNDLTGIEFLTAATSIDLKRNNISDVGSLENLTSLTYLNLGWNDIANIDSLGNLTSLTSLYLRSNSISDISALSSLSSVRLLSLSGNEIADVGPLSGLTALNTIYLAYNHITDVSPLAGIGAAIDVTDQSFDVGAVAVGTPVANPVVGFDGTPMPLDALYQAGVNTFTATAAGPGMTTWDNAGEITMFSGSLAFQAGTAPGGGDDGGTEDGGGEDAPGPDDPVVPGPAAPGDTDAGPGEPTLARTGIESWTITAGTIAAALMLAGGLAIAGTSRRTAPAVPKK